MGYGLETGTLCLQPNPNLTRLSFRNQDRRRTKTGTNHNPDPNR